MVTQQNAWSQKERVHGCEAKQKKEEGRFMVCLVSQLWCVKPALRRYSICVTTAIVCAISVILCGYETNMTLVTSLKFICLLGLNCDVGTAVNCIHLTNNTLNGMLGAWNVKPESSHYRIGVIVNQCDISSYGRPFPVLYVCYIRFLSLHKLFIYYDSNAIRWKPWLTSSGRNDWWHTGNTLKQHAWCT